MNPNTPAPAMQEAVLTDTIQRAHDVLHECRSLVSFHDQGFQEIGAAMVELRALLSKLRAPIADERAALNLPTMRSAFRITEQHGDPDPAKRQYNMVFKFRSIEALDAADDEWRAALASAPVAAEAQLVGYYTDWAGERRYAQEPQEMDEPGLKLTFTPDNPTSDYWHPYYSAPQASAEAFKDLVTHGMSIQRVAPADFLADRQQRAGDVDDREAWAADMVAAGAKHLGDECWEWESDDFLFHLWQVATGRQYRAARADTDKKEM